MSDTNESGPPPTPVTAEEFAKVKARLAEMERRAKSAERGREAAEEQLAPTSYEKYLEICHWGIYKQATVQTMSGYTSAGIVADPRDRYYPLHLKPWEDFPRLHQEEQAALDALFASKTLFPSQSEVRGIQALTPQDIANEVDMRLYQYLIESCFANGFYGLSVNNPDDPDLYNPETPAYKPAIVEARRARNASDPEPPSNRLYMPTRKHFSDQWLVREEEDGERLPVFVVEYKAAHKLPIEMVKMALMSDADATGDSSSPEIGLFEAAVRNDSNEHSKTTPQDEGARKLVQAQNGTAAVVIQAFHYMVEFGLCYSYVASGGLLLLLHFEPEEPDKLYYHLCVPDDEVGERQEIRGPEPGHVRPVMQSTASVVSTLALLALNGPWLSQKWKREAADRLRKWPTPYASSGSEDEKPRDDKDDANFIPPRQTGPAAVTRYNTRSKTAAAAATSRTTRSTGASMRGVQCDGADDKEDAHPLAGTSYCTQACLRGLRNGGPLDSQCPNVAQHQLHGWKTGRHELSVEGLMQRLREQLKDDLDSNCDALDRYGKYGAIGVLFRLRLKDYGYCVVAKGVERAHAGRLEAEQGIYNYLQDKQGDLVPMCLGTMELAWEYITMRGVHLTHMLVMAYGGEAVLNPHTRQLVEKRGEWLPPHETIQQLTSKAWAELAATGVVHGDERDVNVVWNRKQERMMCIDFDEARMAPPPKMRAA